MAFPNHYTHRKVADSNARSCEICYKPSTSVLTTPENKDFFYVCPTHLKDKGFCNPIIDQAAVEARKKQEMDEEITKVKKEYEEKKQKKKEKEKEKDGGKTDKEIDKDTKDDKDKGQAQSEDTDKPDATSPDEESPRIFELKRAFYVRRLEKKRQVEISKRNRERLQNPNFFPSVPKNLP